jgi:predicted P-loop ATPase
VWKSFRITAKSMRFATLLKAAADARLQADLAAADDDEADLLGEPDEDVDDLIGTIDSDKDDLLGETPVAAGVAWATKLDRNEDGAIKPTLHNMVLIVRNDPRTAGLMAFNLFTMEVAQRGTPGKKVVQKPSPKGTKQLTGPIWALRDPVNGDLWTDDKDDAIRDVLEAPIRQGGYAIKVSDRDLRSAVNIVAREQSFHPVREYLERLEWDGVERLDTLFVRYLGAVDTAYTRSVARLALVAGVARVMQPGHKFDFAVILEGLQGKRKSTFIKILGKHWFSELEGDVHDQKQMVESMQGSWVLEIPELSGFGRADIRQIKSFISRTSDKVRLAYARRAQEFFRQCLLIGSTNDREYLRDATGGRRFWPVLCEIGEIDTAGFAAEVDQVWAEAAVIYRVMREAQPHGDLPLYLTGAEAQAEALVLQEDRRVADAEDGLVGRIEAWLDSPETDPSGFADEDDLIGPAPRMETCLLAIWIECLRKDDASYGQEPAQRLGRVMKRIPGWYSDGQARLRNYGKQRIFRRAV